MTNRITWKWIREAYFPSFLADAERAGINPRTLVLYNPGVNFCLFQRDAPGPDHTESGLGTLITEFSSAADAERYMNGMRRGWSILPRN